MTNTHGPKFAVRCTGRSLGENMNPASPDEYRYYEIKYYEIKFL
jgi:hypothetical protein